MSRGGSGLVLGGPGKAIRMDVLSGVGLIPGRISPLVDGRNHWDRTDGPG